MSSPDGRIFSSWKEIATFLGKGVRTVQRWEKTLGLPVRRPNGSASNVVVATESELRGWIGHGGVKNVSDQRENDLEAIRELEQKLLRLEAMHRRLDDAVQRIETHFAQVETAMSPKKYVDPDDRGRTRHRAIGPSEIRN